MDDPKTPEPAVETELPVTPEALPASPPPKRTPRVKSSERSPAQPPKVPAISATGRRKEAVARVRLQPGLGQIVVNGQPYDRYFQRELSRLAIRQPLLVTNQLGKYDVRATVAGGGLTGQAGAVRLGIARALLQVDPALRPTLRGGGLLTRDPRMKERKKYGRKGARKRFQWTKR